MNVLSMSSKTDSNFHISALQWQPCLLKTNSTRVLVTWLITLLLIICPSSYKAHLDNLIGPTISMPEQKLFGPITLSARALSDDGQMINSNVINHVTKGRLG